MYTVIHKFCLSGHFVTGLGPVLWWPVKRESTVSYEVYEKAVRETASSSDISYISYSLLKMKKFTF